MKYIFDSDRFREKRKSLKIIGKNGKAKRMSQSEFISLLDEKGCKIGRNSISKLENGVIPIDLSLNDILIFCEVLDCDLSYLLDISDYSTKEIETVCNYTGLSEPLVKRLNAAKDYPDFLSHAIESYSHDFELLISEIKECLINSTIEYYAQKLPVSHPLSLLASNDQKDSSIHLINCLRLIERLSTSAHNDDWILEKIRESATLKYILPESDNT